MRKRAALTVILFALAMASGVQADVARFTVRVVKAYPHDVKAFTEGLYYSKGYLFESTGLNGRSSVRQVALTTGKIVHQVAIDPKYFGEGIAPWGNTIVGLSWQTGTGFVWSGAKFRLQRTFTYTGEGWGLTQNGRYLIQSDGTPTVTFRDPLSFKAVKTITVTYNGQPIDQINELEWIKGDLYANVWRTRKIVRIDPASGNITGIVELGGLPETQDPSLGEDAVANGIAYDAATDRIFITGKLWPHLYEVRFTPQ